jgi:hypothetical protein
MPLAAAFFSGRVAVPLWLVFKRPDQAAQPAAGQAPAPVCPAGPAERPVAVAAPRAGELAEV